MDDLEARKWAAQERMLHILFYADSGLNEEQETAAVREALAMGADANRLEGVTGVIRPLNHACKFGKAHLVEPLIEARADPYTAYRSVTRPYMIAAAEAAYNDNVHCLEALERCGVDLSRLAGNNGRSTLLHIALSVNASEASRWLLRRGFDPYVLDEDGADGRNAILQARQNPMAVQTMIELGVDLNWRHPITGETLGLRTAKLEDGGVWGLLLNAGVDLDIPDQHGITARARALQGNSSLREMTLAAQAASAARDVLEQINAGRVPPKEASSRALQHQRTP